MEKSHYIMINGEKVPVSEEVYHAYKRPVWVERKRREVRAEYERSLDALAEDGFDIPSGEPPVDEIVEDRVMLDMLMSALDRLDAGERDLINAIFFDGKSEREVATETGIPNPTIHSRKTAILKKLKNYF